MIFLINSYLVITQEFGEYTAITPHIIHCLIRNLFVLMSLRDMREFHQGSDQRMVARVGTTKAHYKIHNQIHNNMKPTSYQSQFFTLFC